MTSLLIPAELDLAGEVAELIAEVDAILCAAVATSRRPPASPVASSVPLRPRPGPAHRVRAVQRSPPASP
ncbi:hypothetical protein ACX9NE_07825 [Mycobacterium sp. ML4]